MRENSEKHVEGSIFQLALARAISDNSHDKREQGPKSMEQYPLFRHSSTSACIADENSNDGT